MARKVFFSFHHKRDSWRAGQIRNCDIVKSYEQNRFIDAASWEAVKIQGDAVVKKWIESQLLGTSVTVVLIGKETSTRKWIKYEIQRSLELGKGIIGIDISGVKNFLQIIDTQGTNPLPAKYPVYSWIKDSGRTNIGRWIESAAQQAGY